MRTFQAKGIAYAKAWGNMANARNPDSPTWQKACSIGVRLEVYLGAWPYLAMENHVTTLSSTESRNKDKKWLGPFFSTKLERSLGLVACYQI